jgi:hypothetical protein
MERRRSKGGGELKIENGKLKIGRGMNNEQ